MTPPPPGLWVYNDGGRAAAGYRGDAGDCAVRAITIALEEDYKVMYDQLAWTMQREPRKARGKTTPRDGVPMSIVHQFLADYGDWEWVPTMAIGTGCTVHLRARELPAGRLIVRVTRHLTAMVDGVIHDTHDPSRGGTRCVYGYWRPLR